MKQISVSEFKKHCLSLFSEIQNTKEKITITKYGEPIATVNPVKNKGLKENPLKNSVIFEDDLISPVNIEWDAE